MIWDPPPTATPAPPAEAASLREWSRETAGILYKSIPSEVLSEAERSGYLYLRDLPGACQPWEVLPATGAMFDVVHVIEGCGPRRLPLRGDLAIVTASLGDVDVNATARSLGDGRRWCPGGEARALLSIIDEVWPTVIEFVAHGDGAQLEGPSPWSKETVEQLLTASGTERLRLVSFLSCFSDGTWATSLARQAVRLGIPRVLAFSAAVEDDAAGRLETAIVGRFGRCAPEATIRDERKAMFNEPRMARAAVTARILVNHSIFGDPPQTGVGPALALDALSLDQHVEGCDVCARRASAQSARLLKTLATMGFSGAASADIVRKARSDAAWACLTGLPVTDATIAGGALQFASVGPGLVSRTEKVWAEGPPQSLHSSWRLEATDGRLVEFTLEPGQTATLPDVGRWLVSCVWVRAGRQPVRWEWLVDVVDEPVVPDRMTPEIALGLGFYSAVVQRWLGRNATPESVDRRHAIWVATAFRGQARSAGVNETLRAALTRSASMLDPLGKNAGS